MAVIGDQKFAVAWKQLDDSGMEHCRLSEAAAGATFAGTVVAVADNVPWSIEYEVRCDEGWRTRAATIAAHAGAALHTVTMEVDDHGRWMVSKDARPELTGCIDVDLGFSPSTNTLPIRRLRLEVGQTATIDAAWLEFPSLVVRRVPQRYTRLAEQTYRYENLPNGFVADITVDARGLVVSYPPGWEQVHQTGDQRLLFSVLPAAELGEASSLYSGLIGSWDLEVIDFEEDGTRRTSRGEWHFGWALEGRAIQDVFIDPARKLRSRSETLPHGNRYGTTIRFYDAAQRSWRIVWINPVSGAVNALVARREGTAIVQEGADESGTRLRWSFVEITRERLHWVGESSSDAGSTWRKQAEFFGRRTSFVPLRG
jgi:hypothetical protein